MAGNGIAPKAIGDMLTRNAITFKEEGPGVFLADHARCTYFVRAIQDAEGSVAHVRFVRGFATPGVNFHFVNEWNARYAFSKLYLDAESDPFIAWDIVTVGVGEAYLDACLARWIEALDNFI